MLPADRLIEIATAPRTLAALRLSLLCSFVAALTNAVAGTIIAWVLVRADFRGRHFFDSIVELPFALPTSVAGITLTFLYSENGWFGSILKSAGVRVAFTPLGIIMALTFVGLPFVIRTVQPVIKEIDPQVDEAAQSLGANPWQTFLRVQLPILLPAIITGFSLSFARALGEYGSVLFISGNLPMKTEIIPLLIMTKLEQFDYDGAAILATEMLLLSLIILVFVHTFEMWVSKKFLGMEQES